MKTCPRCGETKPLEEFSRDASRPSGRMYHCTDCDRVYARKRSLYPASRERSRQHAAERQERYPEKIKAKRLVRSALEAGQLVRPEVCERCGNAPQPASDSRAMIQAHHDDYSRPLDVVWLCHQCHVDAHRPLHARGAAVTGYVFEIASPPSVNNLFRNVPGKGRVKTERYNIWMQAAQWDVLLENNRPRRIEKLTGPVEISIDLGKCRGDIDNRAKPVLDLLVKCGVIADDKQVQLLCILRDSDLKKRTIVTVRPFEKIRP